MLENPTVDVHAHYFGADVGDLVPRLDAAAPRLVIDNEDNGRIMCGETTFRLVEPVLWNVPLRIAEMDRAGVSQQVISPVPVTMEFAGRPEADPAYARRMNDSIAAACAASGGRLLGLGCLPWGDVGLAAEELERCRQLGLFGVEIGTRIGDLDLDAPELDRFWAACDTTASAVFIHPVHGGRGAIRRSGQPYDLGLGMLTDTAIAASSLVFGGVLAKYEHVRVALAHGCGSFPWAYPRLRVAAGLTVEGDPAFWDALVHRLYADTLVFDDEHLRLLVHRFGADRLLLGSDAPFFPDQMAKSLQSVTEATQAGVLPAHTSLSCNAQHFLRGPGKTLLHRSNPATKEGSDVTDQ